MMEKIGNNITDSPREISSPKSEHLAEVMLPLHHNISSCSVPEEKSGGMSSLSLVTKLGIFLLIAFSGAISWKIWVMDQDVRKIIDHREAQIQKIRVELKDVERILCEPFGSKLHIERLEEKVKVLEKTAIEIRKELQTQQ